MCICKSVSVYLTMQICICKSVSVYLTMQICICKRKCKSVSIPESDTIDLYLLNPSINVNLLFFFISICRAVNLYVDLDM